jgi:hypothetical protein
MKKTLILLVTFTIFIVSFSYSVEKKEDIKTNLMSKNPLLCMTTCSKLILERKNIIKVALEILKEKDINKEFRGPYYNSIKLLEKYRAKEAVEILAKIIEYIPERYESDEKLSIEWFHPAARALVEIGQPSIPEMMEIIKKSKSKKQRDLATWVIWKIEDTDQAMNRFEKTIEKYGYSKQFIEAKKYIQSYKPTYRNILVE